MRRKIISVVPGIALLVLLSGFNSFAATVNFQGTLYNASGAPVQGGRVIAGTFKPGFDVSFTNYSCTYGDIACNLDPDNYDQAVADGNFIPLNAGVLTNPFGVFSGSGTSTATGSKIYIFGFTGPQPTINQDFTQAIASVANQFIYGSHFSDGFQTGLTPIPEPGSCGLAALGAAGALIRSSRRRSFASR